MPVEDVFSISGRGTVVTGRVERGIVQSRRRDRNRWYQRHSKNNCTGVEMFRKLLDQGQAGDNVGVLLRGTKREDMNVVSFGETRFDQATQPLHRRDLRIVQR